MNNTFRFTLFRCGIAVITFYLIALGHQSERLLAAGEMASPDTLTVAGADSNASFRTDSSREAAAAPSDTSAATLPIADTLTAEAREDTLPVYILDREVPNNAFTVGEKLTFKIRYGFIKAGYATMEIKDVVTVNDSFPAYHIVSTARSTKTFDVFYKVRDSVETFLDVRGLFSWRYNKRLREGGYKLDLLVDYDQHHGIANVHKIRYHSDEPLRVKHEEKFQLKVPAYVLDVLAAFYYVRTQPLRVGEPVYMTNHDNKKVYDLQVIIQRKEQVKVKAGKFNCIVVSPRLKGESIFKQKGELWIWLTDDQYRVPVQMKSKVVVGSITTELIEIEGIPLPLPAQIK